MDNKKTNRLCSIVKQMSENDRRIIERFARQILKDRQEAPELAVSSHQATKKDGPY